ncbi:MAG TPA: plastocyanin/azurin family copper-binding protein [Acidimicrobiales bacterium]|nr:plastocyanin/azurin family copper-binding protein [Acidimicrobiales bacterium]
MKPTTLARRLFAALALGIVALSAACGGDDGPSADQAGGAAKTTDASADKNGSGMPAPTGGGDAKATSSINVKDFQFDPKVATVKAGEPVTWTNVDNFDHSVFDTGGAFKGENFGKDKTFSHTYDKPGTYPYFCGVHNSMTGTINVT